MINLKTLRICFLLLSVAVFNSCDEDDGDRTIGPSLLDSSTVYDVVRNNGSLTALNAAIQAADLTATLEGEGPFTLFAPDNAAFETLATSLGFESPEDLLANVDSGALASLLTYHVVAGENDAASLTDGRTLTTVEGGELTISLDGDNIQILDATKRPETNPVSNVVENGVITNPANGIVYIVDKVLLPQAAIDAFEIDTRPAIVDLATSNDDLSILVSALGKTDLVGTVAGLENANVLAPTNEAFADLLETLGEDYSSLDDFDNDTEIALLGDILKYHVIPGVGELSAGQAETALEGASVGVVAESGGYAFTDASSITANTIAADIEAINGQVQLVDKVLLPQTALDFLDQLASDDLATTVIDTPELSILEEALVATELVDLFVDDTNESFIQEEDEEDEDFETRRTPTNYTYFKPATVFVPTDAAFEELFTLLGDEYTGIASFDTEDELALLEEILKYHVVEGNISSEDLSAGPVTTVAESDIEVIAVLGTENFVIGDASNEDNANIVIPDVMTRNGVAHVIDKVLLPQSAVDLVISQNEEEE